MVVVPIMVVVMMMVVTMAVCKLLWRDLDLHQLLWLHVQILKEIGKTL